jgi:hypothetical protein
MTLVNDGLKRLNGIILYLLKYFINNDPKKHDNNALQKAINVFTDSRHSCFLYPSHAALMSTFFLTIAILLTFIFVFTENKQNAFPAALAQPKEDTNNSATNDQLSLSNLIGPGSP